MEELVFELETKETVTIYGGGYRLVNEGDDCFFELVVDLTCSRLKRNKEVTYE